MLPKSPKFSKKPILRATSDILPFTTQLITVTIDTQTLTTLLKQELIQQMQQDD